VDGSSRSLVGIHDPCIGVLRRECQALLYLYLCGIEVDGRLYTRMTSWRRGLGGAMVCKGFK